MTNTRTTSTKDLDLVDSKNSITNEGLTQGGAPGNSDSKFCFDLNQIKCFFPSAKSRPSAREDCPKKYRREPSESKGKASVQTPVEQSKTKSNSRSSYARDDSSKSSRSRSKNPYVASDREKSIEQKEQAQAKKKEQAKQTAEHPALIQQSRREPPINLETLLNKNEVQASELKLLKNAEGSEAEKYKNFTSVRPLRIGPESLRYPVQKLGSNRQESSFRIIKPQMRESQGNMRAVNIVSQQKEFSSDYELNVSKVAQHNSFYEDQKDVIETSDDPALQEEEIVEPLFGKEFNPAYAGVMGNSYLITSFEGRRNTLPQTSIVAEKQLNPGMKFLPGTNYYQSGQSGVSINHHQAFFLTPGNMNNIPNTSYLSTESTHEGSDYYHNITPSTSANRLNSSLLSGLNSARQDLNGSGKLDTSWNGEFSNTRGNLRKMALHQKYQNTGKLNHSFNEKLLPSHYKVNSPATSHDMNPNMNYNQFTGQVLPQDEPLVFQHYPSNIVTNQFTPGFDLGSQQPRMQSKIIMNNQAFMGTPITTRTATKNVTIPESDLENLKKDAKSPLLLRNAGTNKRKKAEPQGNTTQFEINLSEIGQDGRTTLMIKNIPNKYNIDLLMEAINKNHIKKYDFLYLPIDFKNKCNVGYAFINFLETRFIEPFFLEFNGKRWEKFNSEKICSIKYARIQGREALIQHFEYSSVMNQHDKKLRPVIVSNIDVHKFGEIINKQRNKL